MLFALRNVRFSNPRVWVKRFQAVDVSRGLVLLSVHGVRRQGGTIFQATLPIAVGRSKRTCELTSSIVPRGTPFHHLVELELLLVHSVTV